MYVIQDKETKTYLSDFSFQMVNKNENKWLYTTYTGLLGTRFYAKKKKCSKSIEYFAGIQRRIGTT